MCGAGGDSPYAVLDKLVPGYYHRRTEQGDICASCCCNNTASEHAMCERLIIDDIVHWARAYKVRRALGSGSRVHASPPTPSLPSHVGPKSATLRCSSMCPG